MTGAPAAQSEWASLVDLLRGAPTLRPMRLCFRFRRTAGKVHRPRSRAASSTAARAAWRFGCRMLGLSGQSRPAALSARAGVYRGVLRLPLCRSRGRARAPSAAQPADDAATVHRGRCRAPRSPDQLVPRKGRAAMVGRVAGTRGRRCALFGRRSRTRTSWPIDGLTWARPPARSRSFSTPPAPRPRRRE